jgi:hypothetical protein
MFNPINIDLFDDAQTKARLLAQYLQTFHTRRIVEVVKTSESFAEGKVLSIKHPFSKLIC